MMRTKIIAASIDNYVYCVEGDYYVDKVGFDIINRYASSFEHVKLLARVNHTDKSQMDIHIIRLEFNNLTVVELPFVKSFLELILGLPRMVYTIKRNLRDCSLLISRAPSVTGFVILKAKPSNLKYCLEVVANPYENSFCERGFRRMHSLLQDYYLRIYCKNADAISYVTKNSLQKRYPCTKTGHLETYYSSIELSNSFFYPPGNRLGDNLKEIRILHVSNIMVGDYKGHEEVIKVTAELKKHGLNVKTRFVGDGPSRENYLQLAKALGIDNDVEFLGFVQRDNLSMLLRDSNLFLFPSKTEGLPKVVIEAMASSIPCVASRVGGIPELLDDDCLFEPTDYLGMAKRIEKMFSSKDDFMKQAKTCYERSWNYEATKLTQRRREFFSRLEEL